MGNPYLDRKVKVIGATGRKSERKVARKLGAKLTPNSGAVAGAKGDMHLGDFLIEAKSTVNDSIGVKLDWLLKIADEALSSDRKPAIALTFTHAGGDPRVNGEWVAVPLHVWKEMFS